MAGGDETTGESRLVVAANLYRATLPPDLRLLSRRSRALSRCNKGGNSIK